MNNLLCDHIINMHSSKIRQAYYAIHSGAKKQANY